MRCVLPLLLVAVAGCVVSEPHRLLGQAAPKVQAATLEGNAVALIPADAEIAILYFWASWCGPCRMATPVVLETAADYKDRGVRVVAVNVGEDRETIEHYASGKTLLSHVVLDPDGAVSMAYRVDSLPTIMLVDQGGTIQAVYEGYAGTLGDELSRDILTLLAGKALVASPG